VLGLILFPDSQQQHEAVQGYTFPKLQDTDVMNVGESYEL
jgi:hypothetical protein